MKKQPLLIISALFFTLGMLALGYFSFGIWTTLVFASGFLGGFILWVLLPTTQVSFSSFQAPYWLTLFCFIFLHRVEENVFKFQEELSSITGTPVPDLTSPALILLVLASVGSWLLIPFLTKRKYAFGYYFAWTFFASMGITELAHFIFPFYTQKPYGYFPGMLSVFFLAPAAWWGMWCLSRKATSHL